MPKDTKLRQAEELALQIVKELLQASFAEFILYFWPFSSVGEEVHTLHVERGIGTFALLYYIYINSFVPLYCFK